MFETALFRCSLNFLFKTKKFSDLDFYITFNSHLQITKSVKLYITRL